MSHDELAVWLGDGPVGSLSRSGRGFQLRFTRRPGVTAALTVAPDGADATWTPPFTRAWFDNLLPEEGRRTAAEAEHGVERGDTFGLLAAIGWECAGAVSVLPEGWRPASGSYQALDDIDVWERLDALPRTVAEARAWGMPESVARAVITDTLQALTSGLAEADRRYPTTPDAMRQAVEAQLHRLRGSDW